MAFLEGITVVALEQAVAAPFATRQLADLGARVIKIERPGGGDFARRYDTTVGGNSSYFVWLNRGKESLELDLKDASSGPVLDALLARADVFVQNLAPGAAARLGLDAATLAARFPHLIHCSISGYGDGGPDGRRKAYDLLIQSEVGLLSVTGTPDEPARVGISIADISAGMYAFSGVLAALYERERTGTVRAVTVSLLDALAEWMSQPAYFATYGGRAAARSGARHPSIAPYGPFSASDGRTVFLGVQTEEEWLALCRDVLGEPALAHDPRFATNVARVENRAALDALVGAYVLSRTADEIAAALEAAGIANARMNEAQDLLSHPQLVRRGRLADVGVPGGTMTALRPPLELAGFESPMSAVPAPGEHTARILRELGRELGPELG
jgi:formyl-CoA transferase